MYDGTNHLVTVLGNSGSSIAVKPRTILWLVLFFNPSHSIYTQNDRNSCNLFKII